MAAIVCHGLQSCLESQLVESRIHSLRLPSPKLTPQPIDLAFKSCFWESNTKPHCEENSYKTDTVSSNPNQCSWSSIQALSNASQGPKEPTYVPPQVKLSWLRLSPKSLELCTENLGNETGTDITESGIDLFSSTDNAIAGGNLGAEDQRKPCQLLGAKKEKEKSQNFPPPLTTMRGSESLRVRPHREGGRLVIEVTKVSSSSSSSVSCFQAERSHGRLRLSLWTDPEEEEDGDNEDIDNQGFETEMNGHVEDEEEEQEAEEEVGEEGSNDVTENYEQNDEGGDAETKGNSWSIIGSEMRMEKYERVSRSRSRSSRCKEGGGDHHENNELLLVNWGEPLWVATS